MVQAFTRKGVNSDLQKMQTTQFRGVGRAGESASPLKKVKDLEGGIIELMGGE